MRPLLLAFVVLVATRASCRADDQIPLDLLNKIKAATVFVKVRTATGAGSGSGFVITVDRDKQFVVTNEHVVAHKDGQFARRGQGNPAEIEVVFKSGSDREDIRKAEVVVADPVTDLAVLRFDDHGPSEASLDLTANVKPVETLPVYMVGFPFGRALAGIEGNPAVTIGRGSISSIRAEKDGRRTIQIDGDLNPGNSGGPVVDSQGRLIGVAVAKISGTTIGFVIPAGEIPKLLAPRVPQLRVTAGRPADGSVAVRCNLDLVDPAKRVRSLAVRFAPADGRQPPRKGDQDTTWPELADAQAAPFKIDAATAAATFDVPAAGTQPAKYLVQLIATYSNNLVARSEPLVVTVDGARPTTVAAKDRVPAQSGRLVTLVEYLASSHAAAGTLKIKSVKVEGLHSRSPLSWSNDGRWLYHLAQDGTVRKFGCPGLKEEAAEPTLVTSNHFLAPSAVGLVASGVGGSRQARPTRSLSRIVVLDFDTLKPVRTIDEDQLVQRVISSAGSNHAYALIEGRANALAVYDLKTGAGVKRYSPADLGVPPAAMKRIVLSHDGKWLVTRDDERLYRFRVDGADVTLEEASPPILRKNAYEQVAVSCDGKWVHSSFAHDAETEARSRVRGRTPNCPFDLFSMDSFAKPATTWFTFNPSSTSFGSDRANGYLYGHTGNSGELQVFDTRGTMVAQYDDTDLRGGLKERMIVHPDGRFVAYLLQDTRSPAQRVVLLELAAAGE